MAERVKIKEVLVWDQGSVSHYRGEDGDYTIVTSPVVAVAVDGRHFLLPTVRSYTEAERADYAVTYEGECLYGPKVLYWPGEAEDKAAAVREMGSINPDLWVEFEPDNRTSEERAWDEYEREQFERMGYGGVEW